ncbi:MAG: 50S ribosomal protein L29 [Gemmatimonadetes bacterium]|nr:50S ribosomal protein L29 [Gemmatimonadota bacterium]
MKATEIREMSADDVAARIAELERERFNLRFRSGTQPLDDPLRLRVIRRDLARLKTVQREKSGAAARSGGK